MQTAAREILTAAAPVWADRRRAMRFPADDAAEVEVAGDPSFTLPGFLRDASRTGVRLALPQPVTRGAQVRISIRGAAAIAGEVRYCRWAGTTYYAGVMLYGGDPLVTTSSTC
ncbi:MAG TPA: PilZ domain-containing protein [Bryobacteraceae bacterium]|jgi:PilZ domain|nr:PilZ domain-containing protein [Bryobacteraceae bacterium]